MIINKIKVMKLKELQNLPLGDVYGYWKDNYAISEGQPWMGGKRERAYNEFSKAHGLTKEIESKFTVAQEKEAYKKLGYNGFNKASYNELMSTL
jgi:hypothetical protein